MKVLNVAEKPAMAKQIANLLSSTPVSSFDGKNKYCKNFEFPYNLNGRSCTMVMTSVLGHVKELDFSAEYSNWALTPPNSLFEAQIYTTVAEDKKGIVKNLEIQGRMAEMLVIWTDCDREGEHIGSEIVQICRSSNPRLDVYRARYSTVTQGELRRSMNNLQRLDERQVAAVEARCELDLRSGAIFTRFQTLKLQEHFASILKEVISYGPCQFPTLGFVVEQYLKVSRFRPETFWYLDLELSKGGISNRFSWRRGHIFDRLITLIFYERSIQQCSSEGSVKIVSVEEKPTSKYRPVPLRTVEFQKAASRFLKISSDQVMNIAEKLYNRGLISYPRTETDMFEFNSEQLRVLVQKQVVDGVFGDYARELIEGDRFRMPRKGKNNDKAHPPIHPTSSGEELTGQERAVFEFVARRFLAACSEDARGMETKIVADLGGEQFDCKGIRVTELNYLRVYKYERWTEQEIAPFCTGESVPIGCYLMKEGESSAPPLLSESDLITCMDKNGIGTDATIHEHIKKIIMRRYAIKGRDSRFIPTRLGCALVEAFDQLGLELSLTQPKIRAKLERDLGRICAGELGKAQVLHESKEMYKKVYAKVEREFERMLRVFNKYLNNGGNSGRGGFDGGGGGHGPGNNSDNDGDDNLPPGNPFDPMPLPKYFPSKNTNTNNNSKGIDDDDFHGSDNDYNSGADGKKKKPAKRATTKIARCSTSTSTYKNTTDTTVSTRGKRSLDSETLPVTKRPRKNAVIKAQPLSSVSHCSCNCGEPAVRRTVMKEGPNRGKEFWACGKGMNDAGNCKFFEWIDEAGSSISSNTSGTRNETNNGFNAATTTTYRSTYNNSNNNNTSSGGYNQSGDDGEDRCKCGLIMKEETMKTGKDAGRKFMKCPKIVQRCGMFVFLDGGSSNNNTSNGFSGTVKKGQKCFKCNKSGHWANSCPN